MAHNFICCRVHLVWSTHSRRSMIPETLQPRLWAYMDGNARNIGLESFAIGGIEDHVHALIGLNATTNIAAAVQKLKANSSRWMHQQSVQEFAWQESYAVFSVSVSLMKPTIRYIRNQKQHHKKRDFREEMREILRMHGIPEDDIFI
ncbi:MAG: IS200/IS605 family transposase [Acidobacteriales bacterium]|nr:IS200/IS605 family transposase [Terriglobales bacterium]